MTVDIAPLTPDLWPAFEDLFGKQGACYGCWCTHFRLPPAARRDNDRQRNKDHHQGADRGRPAAGPAGVRGRQGRRLDADRPARRRARMEQCGQGVGAGSIPATPPIRRVWAISCFFIRAKARGRGLTHRLVDGGIDICTRERRAAGRGLPDRPVEGFAFDRPVRRLDAGLREGRIFTGWSSARPGRPLMRHVLDPEGAVRSWGWRDASRRQPRSPRRAAAAGRAGTASPSDGKDGRRSRRCRGSGDLRERQRRRRPARRPMPDMDGFEVCRRLKAEPAHLPHSRRDDHRARSGCGPHPRARGRRRRLPHQAGERRSGDDEGEEPGQAEDARRRTPAARLDHRTMSKPATRAGDRAPLIAPGRERHHRSWKERVAAGAAGTHAPDAVAGDAASTGNARRPQSLRPAQADTRTGVRHHQIRHGLPVISPERPRQRERRVEPGDHGLEHEADVRPQPT